MQLAEESQTLISSDETTKDKLNDHKRSVLFAMGVTSFMLLRSLSGIMKDTGLDKTKAKQAVMDLIEKGLVAQGKQLSGTFRWYNSCGRRIQKVL